MPSPLVPFLLVGLGGAAGAMARYGLSLVTVRLATPLPLGTLLANLAGCFLIGVFLQMVVREGGASQGGVLSLSNQLLLGVGFCGAFTTMSSFVAELSQMLQRDGAALAFAYLAATLIGSFACFYAGAALIRWLMQTTTN